MGTAVVTLDDVTGAVSVTGTYAGLLGPITAAHIHGLTNQCASIGPIVTLSHTGGTAGTLSGSGVLTSPQITGMIDEQTYINVHSTVFTGGEIRGQIANGIPYCNACDGALSLCPCAQGGSKSGCEIQQGTGGVRLRVTHWDPPGGLATLKGTGFPAVGTPTAIVIRGMAPESPPVVFGDGLRCVGVPLVRLSSQFASSGMSCHPVMHGAGSGAFYYQLWFRNTPIMYCDPTAAFNLSNGVSLVW